jgi:hypothetical protein
MSDQSIDNNNSPIDNQLNITSNSGSINIYKKSRLSARFEKLKEEIEKDVRYNDFIEDFKYYRTKLDGKSMPEKLKDGGFSEKEIYKATIRKQQYSKKLERNKLYESAQIIDLELFALINFNFETYIDPLVELNTDKTTIKSVLNEKVITPILEILNNEGQHDIFLNYTVDDILGMIFFLTGKCHINWANYDNL